MVARFADFRVREPSPLQSARAFRLHRPLRGRHPVHRLCARPACARTGAQQRPWCEVHRGPASGAAGVSGSVPVGGEGAGTRVRSEAAYSRAEGRVGRQWETTPPLNSALPEAHGAVSPWHRCADVDGEGARKPAEEELWRSEAGRRPRGNNRKRREKARRRRARHENERSNGRAPPRPAERGHVPSSRDPPGPLLPRRRGRSNAVKPSRLPAVPMNVRCGGAARSEPASSRLWPNGREKTSPRLRRL